MRGDSDVVNVGTDETFFDQTSICGSGLSMGAIIALVGSVVMIVGIVVVVMFISVARQRPDGGAR
jgi:hypothetical protein